MHTLYIPILNSATGIHLTFEDWLLGGVRRASLDLWECISRGYPIYPAPRELSFIFNAKPHNLAHFCLKGDTFQWRSPQDGRLRSLPVSSLAPMLKRSDLSDPPYVILPSDLRSKPHEKAVPISKSWIALTLPTLQDDYSLLVEYDLKTMTPLLEDPSICGYVYDKDAYDGMDPLQFWEKVEAVLKVHPQKMHVVLGAMDPQNMPNALYGQNIYIATGTPTDLAVAGLGYTEQGTIDLKSSAAQTNHEPISSQCICYTCQNFTQAYIHHLYTEHVLLSTRLLCLHNVSFMSLQTHHRS